jgi:RimJ/RimL family protein N-acetyltransferase
MQKVQLPPTMSEVIIETERLYLRTWQATDAQPYFDINQDPQVTEFLRGPLTMEEVHQSIAATNQHQEKWGFTLWAAELKETHELMGFVGLNYPKWEAPFAPAVEMGWRLGTQYWGQGYATEGAQAALAFGFNTIGLDEIVSFAPPINHRSLHVMEKIGLQRYPQGDFRHTKLPLNHPLSQHVLYRLKKADYLGSRIQE